MFFQKILSKFSIQKQILLGLLPIILVLGVLTMVSNNSFKSFIKQLDELKTVTEENVVLLDIEKDIIELQRNVLVYSYVGYRGVLRKIEYVQDRLENRFRLVKKVTASDPEISDHLEHIYKNFKNYKIGFKEAVKEKEIIERLRKEELNPTINAIISGINKVNDDLRKHQKFQEMYALEQVKNYYLSMKLYANSTEIFSNDSQKKLKEISQEETINKINVIAVFLNEQMEAVDYIEILKTNIKKHNMIYGELEIANRSYLQLVNVVLAGYASEISYLSKSLDGLIKARSNVLNNAIFSNVTSVRNYHLILSFIACVIGVLMALLVARGISTPVNKMAVTLNALSQGDSDIEIPGKDRNDEVGEMAKAAHSFKIMADNLERQTNELEEFAYRTSHDLRSPLISSIGALAVIKKAVTKKDVKTAHGGIDLVEGSLRKLEILVQDILKLTETKNIEEAKEPIILSDLIDDIFSRLKNMDGFERLSIYSDIAVKDSVSLEKNRILLVLENLISNAVKYQDPKNPKPFIKINATYINQQLIINVKDNGLGIPEEYRDSLFQMFKRFHPKTSYGSGLGLYMIKKSIEKMGGDISYKPLTSGSEFIITISD